MGVNYLLKEHSYCYFIFIFLRYFSKRGAYVSLNLSKRLSNLKKEKGPLIWSKTKKDILGARFWEEL